MVNEAITRSQSGYIGAKSDAKIKHLLKFLTKSKGYKANFNRVNCQTKIIYLQKSIFFISRIFHSHVLCRKLRIGQFYCLSSTHFLYTFRMVYVSNIFRLVFMNPTQWAQHKIALIALLVRCWIGFLCWPFLSNLHRNSNCPVLPKFKGAPYTDIAQ